MKKQIVIDECHNGVERDENVKIIFDALQEIAKDEDTFSLVIIGKKQGAGYAVHFGNCKGTNVPEKVIPRHFYKSLIETMDKHEDIKKLFYAFLSESSHVIKAFKEIIAEQGMTIKVNKTQVQ